MAYIDYFDYQEFRGVTTTEALVVNGMAALNFGADADGDIYYRISGHLVRLPAGTPGQALVVNGGGLPVWATLPNSPLSFFNGVTKSGNNVMLGGDLKDNTIITGANNEIAWGTSESK